MNIRLDNLTIGYKDGRKVAESINITIREGLLTCLIGRNGIGKSTLLRTIAGFLPKQKGYVWMGNEDMESLSGRQLSKLVSIVLTGRPDVQNLTVEEMVAMGRQPHTGFWGTLGAKDRLIVDEAIGITGIKNLAGRMTHTLSDGEMQKVMIAKALAQQTPVILLDEPTAFLDYPSKVDLMQMLHSIAHNQCKTILLSTHDLGLVVQLADSILELGSNGLHEVSHETVNRELEIRK